MIRGTMEDWSGRRLAWGVLTVGVALVMACDREPAGPDVAGTAEATTFAAAKGGGTSWRYTGVVPLAGDQAVRLSDVNDAGVAVGRSFDATWRQRPMLRAGATSLALVVDGGEGAAWAVSNGASPFVAGQRLGEDGLYHPVRWTVTLGAAPGWSETVLADEGYAMDVNGAGDLVGRAEPDAAIWRASGERIVVLPPAGGFTGGQARAINDAGHIVLWFSGPGTGEQGYLRLPDGSLRILPPATGASSAVGWDVSDVTTDGAVYVAGTSGGHPAQWTFDATTGMVRNIRVMTDGGEGRAISGTGDLAGWKGTSSTQPMVWTDATGVALPLPRGTRSGRVWAISANGRFAVDDALLWSR